MAYKKIDENIASSKDKGLTPKRNKLIKIIMIIFLPVLMVILFILFKHIPFGYNVVPFRYLHNTDKMVSLAIPKFSFLLQNKEDTYSFHSLRGQKTLKTELKNYVNTLTPITCNKRTYYYDAIADITITEYKVNGNFLYNTGVYHIRNGNYCQDLPKDNDYEEKIGSLPKQYTLDMPSSNLQVFLTLNKPNSHNEWLASLEIIYQEGKNKEILEQTSGIFKIEDGELSYSRREVHQQSKQLDVPATSSFVMKRNKLILKENYLEKYESTIILK